MIRLCFFVILLFLGFNAVGQKDHSRFIVQLNNELSKEMLSESFNSRGFPTIKEWKNIRKNDFVYSLVFEEHIEFTDVQASLRNSKIFKSIKIDHPVSIRKTPNDPIFSDQWNLEMIQAIEAWDITTGGVTPEGHDIVVAVVDNGFDVNHEDLRENIWTNPDEIPGDGLDNDGNGYIDDYYGLHIPSGSDAHIAQSHGTGVCGILGAKGNNNKGLTGVNWNIKMMLISGAQFESQIIEAYEYARVRRQLFNESNGQEGDLVVATNSSFGIDNANANNFQLWCNEYDLLGQEGILSVVSTTNNNTNVDEDGDMPSTCTSSYVIAVTNTTRTDNKLTGAGYGATHIDLGAPGDDTESTEPNSTYGGFGGTSASCPHVTGAVSLLYSVDCNEFVNSYMMAPASAALSLKDIILNNTDPNTSLEGITLTGGRLNLYRSVLGMDVFCMSSLGEDFKFSVFPNPIDGVMNLEFETNTASSHELTIYDAIGRLVYQENITPILFGKNIFEIRSIDWIKGAYFVRLSNGEEIISKQIIKVTE